MGVFMADEVIAVVQLAGQPLVAVRVQRKGLRLQRENDLAGAIDFQNTARRILAHQRAVAGQSLAGVGGVAAAGVRLEPPDDPLVRGDFRHAAAVAEKDIAIGQHPGIVHQAVRLVLPDDLSVRGNDHEAGVGGNEDLPLGHTGEPAAGGFGGSQGACQQAKQRNQQKVRLV